MNIRSDYCGGNIIVHTIRHDMIKLSQDLWGTKEWWFWWNFCIEGAEGKTLTFSFDDEVVGPFGPAKSNDGFIWSWCSEDCFINHNSFIYSFSNNESCVYFAFSLPYQAAHFEYFRSKFLNNSKVCHKVLTISEQKRAVPLIVFGEGNEDILFACRHHCCESTASYTLEGVMLSLINNKIDILKKYKVHVIPFMDIDGVEAGEQGKDRMPHDHNRDYIDEPIYVSVRALKEYSRNLNLKAYIDFHSPWKWGPGNDVPHIYLGPGFENVRNDIFIKRLTYITSLNRNDETIIYDWAQVQIPYTGSLDKPARSDSHSYFAFEKHPYISVSLETPYFGNLKRPYTVESLRIWGKNILEALIDSI